MTRNLLARLCFLLAFIPGSLFAQEYSLDDLYQLALQRSEIIKISEEDLYISEGERDRALSSLVPTLSAFGHHTRYSEEKSRNSTFLQPEYTNEWGLRLDQSLSLSGRELTALRIARQGIKKSMVDLNAVKEEYLLTVASAYYDVLKSKKAMEIADANVERLTKYRDAARTRLEVGEVTKTVLLRAEAELAGAQSDSIKSENNRRLTKSMLARAVGITGDYQVKEPEPGKSLETGAQESMTLLYGDCSSSMIECLKERAFTERAEIKTLSLQKQIAEDRVTFARGLYWPDLSIEGVYLRQENEPSTSFELKERIYGALKLNFPFFEGGLRKAEVGQEKARLKQAEYSLADMKHSVGVEVENAYLNLLTISAVIKELQAQVKFAADNFNSVTKQFQHGLADSVDVMDANTLLVTSERELANAEYDYQLAALRLQRSTGTLLKTVVSNQP